MQLKEEHGSETLTGVERVGSCMRQAICHAAEHTIRIFFAGVSEWLFYVVCELQTKEHYLLTCWFHEDGIFLERKNAPKNHPVHKITCLSDLYQKAQDVELKELSERLTNMFDNIESPK